MEAELEDYKQGQALNITGGELDAVVDIRLEQIIERNARAKAEKVVELKKLGEKQNSRPHLP